MKNNLHHLYEELWSTTKQLDEARAKLFDVQRDQYFLKKEIARIKGEEFETDAQFECGATRIVQSPAA
jgi:hypothetical protein